MVGAAAQRPLGGDEQITLIIAKPCPSLFCAYHFDALSLAMMNAGRAFSLRNTLLAQIALIGQQGKIGVLPRILPIAPGADLGYLDTVLIRRQALLHLTGQFA
jgi:hypothetical protein